MSRRLVLPDPDACPPACPRGAAPPHLATRGQLRATGLRPGRQGVQALVLRDSPRGGRPRAGGCRYAQLYDAGRARPRITMTAARRAASLEAALAARMTCPRCGASRGYVPSRRAGTSSTCATGLGNH